MLQIYRREMSRNLAKDLFLSVKTIAAAVDSLVEVKPVRGAVRAFYAAELLK